MARLDIICNEELKNNIFELKLSYDKNIKFEAGQFVHVGVPMVDGILLKRPLSVHYAIDGIMSIVYEVRGKGTLALSKVKSGSLEVLYFQGEGFKIDQKVKRIMLLGGGIGVPPLYAVLEQFSDIEVKSYLGYQNSDKVVLNDRFANLSSCTVCTDDGSYGEKGYAIEYLKKDIKEFNPDLILACGPKPMIKGLQEIENVEIQVSMEERMGCGYGGCLVCVCETNDGNKRVCADGPVFNLKDLVL